MKKEEFASALNRQTGTVHVSSRLRQKTLDAACGKETMKMKRKISAAVLAAVLSVVFCAAALAVAGRAGMLDHLRLFSNKYIPENTDAAIGRDVYATGNELIDISVRELYYDGHTSRLTVDVTPKSGDIFLFNSEPGARWRWMNQLNPEFEEGDARTVKEVYEEGGYAAAYLVSMSLYDGNNGFLTGSMDCHYTAPGVLTFFLQDSYAEALPEREVSLCVIMEPFFDAEENPEDLTAGKSICLEETLTLTSSADEEKVWVSTGPVVFGDIGVTLEQMQLFVKPQELYVKMQYTVSDTELNRRIYSANTLERERLGLEVIDPSAETDEPHLQRLKEGLTGHVIRRMVSGKGEMPMRFVEEFTLGLNELSDCYTLRVYDFVSEARYDSAVVKLREAAEEEG